MLPIIFIHSGNHDYLPVSLVKARLTNPSNPIILLGDRLNAHFGSIVYHFSAKDYFKNAKLLADSFINFSTNPHEFELICLQRWLILLEFMEQNRIDKCLYLDSDVLIFDEIESDAHRFQNFGMTVTGISGHTNFIQNRDTLKSFCSYILKSYQEPGYEKILTEKYKEFQRTHEAGGISDMTYFTEFRATNINTILDVSYPLQGKAFDITVTYTHGFIPDQNRKKIEWKEGKPFATLLSGELVEMRSLHFQGSSKKWLKEMAQLNNTTFEALYTLNKGYTIAQKIWKKLAR